MPVNAGDQIFPQACPQIAIGNAIDASGRPFMPQAVTKYSPTKRRPFGFSEIGWGANASTRHEERGQLRPPIPTGRSYPLFRT